ncbi:hypothetical protein DSM106972_048970 [Dulcicalothrix desertica PCC 7102]|uniref:Uncharacterized protein n=1 Tax=Dulcicalothrix desertica PCC 7102 TaxID=232991 RepID=A0A433VD31_9CYAN|nr:hypothetical protein DSM106972_048970 [Dulcicalothrix desertica PCC 7102]TWH43611.1 hypothetical protein CAL7102_07348 [Dulcicalothrix desertica PCC 7102]
MQQQEQISRYCPKLITLITLASMRIFNPNLYKPGVSALVLLTLKCGAIENQCFRVWKKMATQLLMWKILKKKRVDGANGFVSLLSIFPVLLWERTNTLYVGVVF